MVTDGRCRLRNSDYCVQNHRAYRVHFVWDVIRNIWESSSLNCIKSTILWRGFVLMSFPFFWYCTVFCVSCSIIIKNQIMPLYDTSCLFCGDIRSDVLRPIAAVCTLGFSLSSYSCPWLHLHLVSIAELFLPCSPFFPTTPLPWVSGLCWLLARNWITRYFKAT